MSHDNSGRLSEIRDLTTDLETQRDEATRQGREAQSASEIRAAQDRLRTIQRSSEDLGGELERMRIANTRASTSTRHARPSLQGQPSSSSRQSHRRTSSSSNTGSTSAPRRSREASRTTHSPDIRPSTTLEARSSRQQHHRASRSEDVPQGTSSNYGQPTTYQPGTSSGQGFGQATGIQPFSDYQPPSGFQQNMVPQAPSFQAQPVQQPSYYRGYTTSDTAPSLTTTSGQGDSTDSTESSEDEYVNDRGSPYWGSRRQLRDVVASVAARRNTEPAQGHRSHHGSTSGSGVYEPPANPSQGTGRPSSSRNIRSSSNTTNTAAGSGRLPRTRGPILPSPADSLPRQMATPIEHQPVRPWTPLPPPNQQRAPEYQLPPLNPSSQPGPSHSQSGPAENRYPTGRAPPSIGAMTAQMQQLGFNRYTQQEAPMGSGSGIPMSGTSIGYPQQPHARRASSPNTSGNAYQNTVPRRMPTPPLGSNTIPSASRYPASHQPTSTTRRGMSPGRLGPRVQLHGTQRQSGTLPPLGGPNSTVGPSMFPTGHTRQPSGRRGRDPSPLRAGHYGTSGQGRNLTPPRGTRGRRQ